MDQRVESNPVGVSQPPGPAVTPLFLELAILLGVLLSPLVPAPWGAVALLVLAVLWLHTRPPRREVWGVGAALLVAFLALATEGAFAWGERVSETSWQNGARRRYPELWQGLWQEAGNAARSFSHPPQDAAATLDAFRRLAHFEVRAGGGRHSLLLLDPDGNAVAWAGEGLLHDLRPEAVPRSGPYFVAGWSAVTLLAVQPLDDARRPWRVVAGASFPAYQLPWSNGLGSPPANARWSLVRDPREIAPGAVVVNAQGLPTLVVARGVGSAASPASGLPVPERPEWPSSVAWAAIGFALLALAVMRGVGVALPSLPATSSLGLGRPSSALAPLILGGLLACGAAARIPLLDLGALLVGLSLSTLGLRGRRARPSPSRRQGNVRAATAGAFAVLALVAAAWAEQLFEGPLDLGGSLRAEPHVLCLRLAFAAAACGLLCLAGRGSGLPTAEPDELAGGRDRWAWLSLGLLLAGSAAADLLPVSLLLLAAGGAVAALWAGCRELPRSGSAVAALALIAVLAASGAAETAYRLRLESFAAAELLPRFAPPAEAEVNDLARSLAAFFQHRDLRTLAPHAPDSLERQDLAFALWRSSPLARRHTLSALVVEPLSGASSSFSFGMPLPAEGPIDERQVRLAEIRPPIWQNALISGQAMLTWGGVPWARARYWLLPRPGFAVADRRDLGEVEVGLLKGEPAASPLDEMPWPALYALYAADGRATLSPWEEAPPLPGALARGARSAWVNTPDGPARAYARRTLGGWEVVYLPFESPLDALERTATPALAVLLLVAFASLLALLLSLPRAAFRDLLRRTVRSYSKRLLLVYTALLLVPLLLLNAVLVRTMGERLEREQRTAGEAALNSAQKELGDRFLSLPPGFGIDTALNDALLTSLSQVVHHEVNLYWRSSVTASSKHELFTAGLLPKRIPGEIYSRLALLGFDLSSRTNHAGGTEYLELYAPVRVPGVVQNEERLFLSIPLLAQEDEAAEELAHLRRRAFLFTAALFVLSLAVGSRLARNFTRPLAQLVEGTRRIAGGAKSLDLALPSELELAALVEAVDEMARRIAEGRERLLREKKVVERVVENITSGVVSVDRERRVLMHNRVAAELLGVHTGQTLEGAIAPVPRLAPVATFLRSAGGEMARATVRLAGPGRTEESGAGDGSPSNSSNPSEDGGEREWTLIWAPLPGPGEPSALLVVEDATEVLRGQRLLAWAEMARIIAHEIKNPLTPIRLSTEHMREVYARDPEHFEGVFERCTTNILGQVDELRSIAAEFSAYSAIPRIDLKPGDLTAAIADLVEGYRAAPPEGVAVELEADGPIPTRFDAKLLGRAVRNLLENALRASAGGGKVVVKVGRGHNGTARIEVADHGPGVRPELLSRIFDPYFSTHDTGTGLGLPIARRIAEEHGGTITAHNRPGGGLEVAITLPVG
jgi:signal transduction histidine kinase